MTPVDTIETSGRAPVLPDDPLTRRVATFVGKSIVALPLTWPDSANWLWRSEELSPQLYKLARTGADADPFWRGLKALFGLDRWAFPHVLTDVAGMLPPRLPMAPLPTTFLGRIETAPLWSQPWRRAETPSMSTAFAASLGEQLAMLHHETAPGWGHPAGTVMPLTAWPEKARGFAERAGASEAAARCTWPTPRRAVWSLPDVRVDQYLLGATDRFWCDWEALVWAPLELDLCLVELLLENRAQRDAFLTAYGPDDVVDLGRYRHGMRLLARLLNLHGEAAETWIDGHPAWLTI